MTEKRSHFLGISEIVTTSPLQTRLADLCHRSPVCIQLPCTTQQAAQTMTREHVSSLLIMQDQTLLGIITDRDLRHRLLAAGLPTSTPLEQIMTPHPTVVSAQATAWEALLLMTHQQIHHLPVQQEHQIIGLISSTDLIRLQTLHPLLLVGELRKQQTVQGLIPIARQIPALLQKLIEAHMSTQEIGMLLSTVYDALTQQLLALAENLLGSPPFAYAWVSLGSQARQEQSVHSDQDNALILEQSPDPSQRSYFRQLAEIVSDGLHLCGQVYCPGQVMATNPQWSQPLSNWRSYFDDWLQTPHPDALLQTSIFFDMRAIHDPQQLVPQLRGPLLQQTPHHTLFLAHMARNALRNRPPLGLFRRFVLEKYGPHRGTFDCKHFALMPLIDLARMTAISHGLESVSTLDRLQQAEQHHCLHPDDARNLQQTYLFLANLRLRQHAQQIANHWPIHHHIAPQSLSSLEQHQLRESFKIIQHAQQALSARYSTDRLG